MSNTSYDPEKDGIEIEEFNPRWAHDAKIEIEKIRAATGSNWVDLQHIGSTAIPNLNAKPIIDLMIGVRKISDGKHLIAPLESLDYQFWSDNPARDKMFFVKGMPPFGTKRSHHVHVWEYGSDFWKARLVFRDYLRANPDEGANYLRLKESLSREFKFDREAYSDGKNEYVESVLRKAGYAGEVAR